MSLLKVVYMQERTQQTLLRQGHQLKAFISDFVLFPSPFHGFLRDLAYRNWEKHLTAVTLYVVQSWFTKLLMVLALNPLRLPLCYSVPQVFSLHYGKIILYLLWFCYFNVADVLFYRKCALSSAIPWNPLLCLCKYWKGTRHGVHAIWRVTFAVSCCLPP